MKPPDTRVRETFLRSAIITTAVLVPLSLLVLGRVGLAGFGSDLPAHLGFLIRGAEGRGWPPHPFFHLTVWVLSLLSVDPIRILWVAVFVLSAAIVAKALISLYVLSEPDRNPYLLAAIVTALMLAFPLPNWWRFPQIYLGQLSPNVWHNPTYIFVAPFTLLLFFVALRAQDTLELKDFSLVAVLMVANALAKPNYLLAFAPVFGIALPVTAAWKRGVGKELLAACLTFIPVLGVLLLQYRYMYALGQQRSGITFFPLGMWRAWSPYPLISLIISIAFPLLVAVLYFDETKRDKAMRFAWPVFGVALAQAVLLAETKVNRNAGNFFWGSYSALYILFLWSAAVVLRQKRDWKFYASLGVLSLHAGAGVFYVVRQVMGLGFR